MGELLAHLKLEYIGEPCDGNTESEIQEESICNA